MNGPNCVWCGLPTDAEFVDIGVGFQQVTGGHCFGEVRNGRYVPNGCGGYEMAHHQIDGMLSEVEMAVGWRGPYEDQADLSSFNPDPETENRP